MGPDGAGLTSRVEQYDAALVLVLAGRLTPATGSAARSAILHCWAECPPVLVLDLAELAAGAAFEPIVAALAGVRDWPPVPVLACAPEPVLAGLPPELSRRFPTRDQALTAAATTSGTADRVTVTLAAGPMAPASGRAVLNQACQDWQVHPDVAAAAEVIVSELCANATVHARTAMRLVIRRTPEALHIVVRDWDLHPPRARPLPADGLPVDSGNGLPLIAAFASNWGMMPAADGKAVWASLRLDKRPDG